VVCAVGLGIIIDVVISRLRGKLPAPAEEPGPASEHAPE
jgi:membrane-associated protein